MVVKVLVLLSVLEFLTGSGAASRASAPCEVHATVASSDAWMATVRRLPLARQVAALRQRVACDAGVHGRVFEPVVCLTCVSAEARQAYQAQQQRRQRADAADPRPRGVVLLCLVDGRVLAATEAAEFERLVTKKTVRNITFWESSKAVALAGARAAEGLVVVTTKSHRPAGS